MALNDQIPTHAAAVTAGITSQPGKALYCGGAGDVTLVTEGGETVTFAVGAGQTLVISFVRVTAATATGLVRLW
jgi:hypothetical protein